MTILKKIKISILIIIISCFLVNYSLAEEGVSNDTIPTYTDRADDFAGQAGLIAPSHTTIIKNSLNIALGLLGLIFLVLIIYSGFMWMTSAGNEEKVKKAKLALKNSIIGVIIILFSFIITQFVFNTIDSTTKPVENNGIFQL